VDDVGQLVDARRRLLAVRCREAALGLPTRYDQVVNMKAAGTLGRNLSPTFVAEIDEIIDS